MGKNDRFQIIYTQGITDITRILLDPRTGAYTWWSYRFNAR